MIEKLRERVREALQGARAPVVMCSFGKDSLLLLKLALEVKPDVPALWFHHDLLPSQEEFAERIILDWGLPVFSYPPAQRFVLPAGEGMTLVSDYSVGPFAWPVLMDAVHSDRCALKLDQQTMAFFPYDWDVTLTGWKECDSHPLVPAGSIHLEGLRVGGTTFRAPLRDLADDDVWSLIRELNIPFDQRRYAGDDSRNPDVLLACTRCLGGEGTVFCPDEQRTIRAHVWPKEKNLADFRARLTGRQEGLGG